MALTKTSTVITNDATMTAGAADVTNGSNTDLSTYYQATVLIRFTNGGTAPTVAPQCRVQMSTDSTAANYIDIATVTGGLVNSGHTDFPVYIPDTAKNFQVISGANTGQNVTLRIVLYGITAF